MRFQVRKKGRLWQVWIFMGRSWQLMEEFAGFDWAMILATGQDPYGKLPGWRRELHLKLDWGMK